MYKSGKLINTKYRQKVYLYSLADLAFEECFDNLSSLKRQKKIKTLSHNQIDKGIILGKYVVSSTQYNTELERLNYFSKYILYKK